MRVRARAAGIAVTFGVLVVVISSAGSSGVTVDRSAQVAQALEIGVTHTQQAPDGWKPAAATARAKQILRETTDVGNQHLMGFGALNPAPTPDTRDWSTLDARIRLIVESGVVPVITLCCAPDWMKGGPPGRTDWSRIEVAPDPAHYDDFAALAAEVAARYPQVKHFVVWNELKGFHDDSSNDWDAAGYTRLYNLVHAALKEVDPSIAVGGPYVPMDSWSSPSAATHPSGLSGDWGVIDQRALDAVRYWLDNAVGADFVAVDGANSTRDRGLTTTPVIANEKFAAVTRWLRSQTDLPVWWMEMYPDVDDPDQGWNSPYRADVALDAILRFGDAGGAVALLWQPEGNARYPSVGLWSSTSAADGGQPQPLVERLTFVREQWRQGAAVRYRWDDGHLRLEPVRVAR